MYAGSKYESHYTVWTAWISIRVRVRVRVRVYFILKNLAPPGTTVHVPTASEIVTVNNIVEAHCLVVELEMERNSKQFTWHRSQELSVTAEEDPRGRNVLLLTSMQRELLTILSHFKLRLILYSYDSCSLST